MGFSYVVAVAVLLSSSLIFFGMVYSDFVHADAQLKGAQDQFNQNNYDYLNSQVSLDGYNYTQTGSNFTVTLNVTNTGSVTLDMNGTNVLLNGTLVNFTYSSQYLFPLGNESLTFGVSGNGSYSVEMVFNTGYKQYAKVTV